MSMTDIEQLIPHRSPFLFIDEIIKKTSTDIICKKKITSDDRYIVFGDTSGEYISEVTLIECLLQSGACLLSENENESICKENKRKFFIGSPIVNFKNRPEIGDTLIITVSIIQRFGDNSRLQGKIVRASDLVLEGTFFVGEKKAGESNN